MPLYLIILCLVTLPISMMAAKVFKFAVDDPDKALRKRKNCIVTGLILGAVFVIAGLGGAVDAVPVGIGCCYWILASMCVKIPPRS